MTKKTFPLFIGTYTENSKSDGIYAGILDTETGKIEKTTLVAKIVNPSYLVFDKERRVIFSVSETSDFLEHAGGSVSSFAVQDDMSLKLLGTQPTYGAHPCHLCLSADSRKLFVANYTDGSLCVFPVSATGIIEPLIQTIQHEGCGTNPKRQEQAHVHFVSFASNSVCVADLGLDKIFWYAMRDEKLAENSCIEFSMPSGSGPRHFVFHPHYPVLYVLQELSNQVITVQLDEKGEPLLTKQIVSTLPETFVGESTGAAIRINKEGTRLFVSNRGHDSVTVFGVSKDGMIQVMGIYPSGGESPRDICLSPDEKWFLCANQSGEISALRVDEKQGELSGMVTNTVIDCPVNLLFL